jgi:hypothetical protein
MIWLENYYNADQIIEQVEDCSKDCSTCSKELQTDCRIEMREMIHSLAIIVKQLTNVWVNANVECHTGDGEAPATYHPPAGLYG